MLVADLEHADIKDVAQRVKLELCAVNSENYGAADEVHVFRYVSDPEKSSE
jgi:hypothetical protein